MVPVRRFRLWSLSAWLLLGDLVGVASASQIEIPGIVAFEAPPGYRKISKRVADDRFAFFSKLNPRMERQYYEVGLASVEGPDPFVPPYILVQHQRTGRAGPDDLKTLIEERSTLGDELKATDRKVQSVSGVEMVAEPVWDADRRLLWTRVAMVAGPDMRIITIAATFFTETGTLSFLGYTLDRNQENFEPVFRTIVESVVLHEDLRYQPRLGDLWVRLAALDLTGSGSSVRGAVVLFGPLIMILAGFGIRLRSRS